MNFRAGIPAKSAFKRLVLNNSVTVRLVTDTEISSVRGSVEISTPKKVSFSDNKTVFCVFKEKNANKVGFRI